jgi:hypothetical protein
VKSATFSVRLDLGLHLLQVVVPFVLDVVLADAVVLDRRPRRRSRKEVSLGQMEGKAAVEANCSGARVSSISSISSISSRGEGLDPNLLYPPLEEEEPHLFPQSSQKLLYKCC